MVRTARINATIVKTTLHVVYNTETVMTVDVLTPANNLHDAKDVSLVCMGLIVRTTVAYIVRTVIVTKQQALVWTAVRVDSSDVSVTKLVPLVNMAASAVKVADTVNSTCYHVDGSCKAGCEAGYKASACKTPCDDGEYGQNCQYMCTGNCINGEACDKASGHCRSCVEGYQGFKCDRDIRQSPTSSDTKKNDVDDLKMNKMILENEKTQKEIQKLEEEIEVLRVRKNVLLRLQGILSELSQVATKLLKDS